MTQLAIEKILWIKPNEGIAASGRIPKESEFFKDHFPDFPILPGVLALEMLKQTAEAYFNQQTDARKEHYFLRELKGTRFSLYLKPGDVWESKLQLVSEEGCTSTWKGELMHDGRVAVTAQLVMEARPVQDVVNH